MLDDINDIVEFLIETIQHIDNQIVFAYRGIEIVD